MVKLAMVASKPKPEPAPSTHRTASSEGEAVRHLLEQQGYPVKKTGKDQLELACPFHQEPGEVPKNKSANFYVNRESGLWYCHSASCGEKGNLQVLERFFGLDPSMPEFQGREQKLIAFEQQLTTERRNVLYGEGINDTTIERFRVGWVDEFTVQDGNKTTRVAANCYVFPYLEARRPVAFRFYDPQCNGPNGSKYWWEPGTTARLYNSGDAIGDQEGRVFITEGEKKAMLLAQLGYAAVGLPGASNFKKEWHEHFAHAKKIVVCLDNDNPDHHVYAKCNKCGEGRCVGHNPGQEAAVKIVDTFGWRASNVVLPLPEGERKCDINEYFVRDGNTAPDFAELALGIRKAPFIVRSLAEIEESPPDEAAFIVDHGILPRGGRLLISGAPKAGKSLLVEQMALSIASGIPFLHRFPIDEPRRVLLLDRELSERALFDRLQAFTTHRPGYKVGYDNLLVDHDHHLRLDLKDSYGPASQLVEQNGADVIILDTAYKFFQGDMESSGALRKVFDTLDRLIQETGVSVVVTHHQRKKVSGQKRGQADVGDQDNVAGSFLWTGWPNATILLDFMDRKLNSPFNVVASFVAFRDAAPPEPLALYRDKDSINYSTIQDYVPDQESTMPTPDMKGVRPNTETVGDLLIKVVPTVEDDFLHLAATKFGCRPDTIRPYLIDLIDKGYFVRTNGRPPVLKYAKDVVEETFEEEQGLPEHDPQLRLVTEIGDGA